MPIQPLEIYEVDESGDLVLKHKDLKEALVSQSLILIMNHNDKTLTLWIGKGASTRVKFAGARASRRFLTERNLSYRVRSCDEGEEPDWFQDLFKIRVAVQGRDEPPRLEVLAILNEMKAEDVPEGYKVEACIVSRDFYVPVEYKSSIMGKDTSTIKFDKSSYLPEGFFMLPSEAYRPRLLVKNGKVLALDLLVSTDLLNKEQLIGSLRQELKEKTSQIETLETLKKEGQKKDQQIRSFQQDISKKNQQIDTFQKKLNTIEKRIASLQEENSKIGHQFESLQQDISEKAQQSDNLQELLNKKDKQIDTLQKETSKQGQQIESLQQDTSEKAQQIESLQEMLNKKEQFIQSIQQEIAEKDKQVQEEVLSLKELEKKLQENETTIKNLEGEMKTQLESFQKREKELQKRIDDLEPHDEPEVID